MKKIKFWTDYCERKNQHKYAHAYVVDEMPKTSDHVHFIYDDEIVESVRVAMMDCEQPTQDVWEYDIYELEISDAENREDIDFVYVAVPRKDDEV